MKLFVSLITCAIFAVPAMAADKDFDASKLQGK